MMKKMLFAFAGLVLLLALGVNFLLSNINGYIRTAIIQYGSEATKTDVGLDRVKINIGATTGTGELDGFTVGNPQGFSSAKSIGIGTVALSIDTASINSKGPIIIREVIIKKPQVAYELTDDGSSNLQTIQNNTKQYATAMASKPAAPAPADKTAAPATPGQQPRKVVIKDLLITDGNVSISQSSLKGQKLATSLPTIHLTDIGQASGGATAAQVAEQILGSISSAAAQSAIGELAKQKISGVLKDVPAAAIGGAAVDNVGSQIKGLLGQ